MFGTIRNVNAETLRHKDLKYPTHDLCLAKISHSSLVQKIHALVALPLDAGILCTSDLCEIQNTLLIIRDSLRSSSHDIVGYLLPATRHQWGILNPYAAKSQHCCNHYFQKHCHKFQRCKWLRHQVTATLIPKNLDKSCRSFL